MHVVPWFHLAEAHAHAALEQIEYVIKPGIVPSFFDEPASARRGRTVSAVELRGLSEGEAATDVRQIHCDLTCKRNVRTAPAWMHQGQCQSVVVDEGPIEPRCHAARDELAQPLRSNGVGRQTWFRAAECSSMQLCRMQG